MPLNLPCLVFYSYASAAGLVGGEKLQKIQQVMRRKKVFIPRARKNNIILL
jgi:hypothetical protein